MLQTLQYEFRDGKWVPVAVLVPCGNGSHGHWYPTPDEFRRLERIRNFRSQFKAINFPVQASLAEVSNHRWLMKKT